MGEQTETKGVNLEWLRRNIPCQQACPVQTNAGGYCHLIALGRYEEAYALAAQPNPLASVCGHICAAPCEEACRREALDEPVAIRALKRFVSERYGVYSKPGRLITVNQLRTVRRAAEEGPPKGDVAIIGAGPAGLAAAHDLALLGHRPVIFEAAKVPGGMLYLGIPEYRLPRYIIHAQADYIESLGVTFCYGKRLGRDFSLDDLRRQGFRAIFIAIGAHKSRELSIEGVNLDGVFNGIDYLLNANLNYRVDVGDKVVVIGGGNVAIDVARSVLRFQTVDEEYSTAGTMRTAMDVARSAMRFGAKEVTLACLEPREQMPAFRSEVEDAEREGIFIRDSVGPKRILGQGGVVRGVEFLRVKSVFDADGRFNPTFYPHSEEVIECDTVILAIGQQPDLSFLGEDSGIAATPRGTIAVDPDTLATSAPDVFAGGDVAFGPRNVIAAVADGRKAAASIHRLLTGKSPAPPEHKIFIFPRGAFQPLDEYDRFPRQPVPALPIERRIGIAEVELGYDEPTARIEASRCLRCWVNTIFEGAEEAGSECILCGGCVDVCPEYCIELVSAERMSASPELAGELAAEFGLPGQGQALAGEIQAVMIKDETKCIRCGLCERRCPVGCITMESFLESEGALTQ